VRKGRELANACDVMRFAALRRRVGANLAAAAGGRELKGTGMSQR
jgi:hypothetical protein